MISLERLSTPLLGDLIESCLQVVGPQNGWFTLASCHNQYVVHVVAVDVAATASNRSVGVVAFSGIIVVGRLAVAA